MTSPEFAETLPKEMFLGLPERQDLEPTEYARDVFYFIFSGAGKNSDIIEGLSGEELASAGELVARCYEYMHATGSKITLEHARNANIVRMASAGMSADDIAAGLQCRRADVNLVLHHNLPRELRHRIPEAGLQELFVAITSFVRGIEDSADSGDSGESGQEDTGDPGGDGKPEDPPKDPPPSGGLGSKGNGTARSGGGYRRRAVSSHSSGVHSGEDRRRSEDQDLVRQYLQEIGRYKLLDKEGEVKLAQRIEAGLKAADALVTEEDIAPSRRRELRRQVRDGDEAKIEFTNANLRLVVSLAKKYQASGMPLLDLVQEGNIGLMRAVNKFEWRKGFKFSTYATWWIRQALQRGVANQARIIRLPVHAGDSYAKVLTSKANLESKLGRTPTAEEIAEDSCLPLDKVTEVFLYASDPLSLDEPIRDDADAERGDFVADKSADTFEQAAISLLPGEVNRLLAVLDERERTILRLRFGLDGQERTLEEIAEHFGVTRERIRQLEARALAKLRHPAADVGGVALLY